MELNEKSKQYLLKYGYTKQLKQHEKNEQYKKQLQEEIRIIHIQIRRNKYEKEKLRKAKRRAKLDEQYKPVKFEEEPFIIDMDL